MTTTTFFSKNNINSETTTLVRAENKISTELDGETVILDMITGIYSGLDETGTSIWNLLEEPKSFIAIQKALQKKYDVPAEQCATDMITFLQALIDNQLITINEK